MIYNNIDLSKENWTQIFTNYSLCPQNGVNIDRYLIIITTFPNRTIL